MTNQYEYKTYSLGMTISETPLSDDVMDAVSYQYTSALAQSMASTREALTASILNVWAKDNDWEVEVDFGDKQSTTS